MYRPLLLLLIFISGAFTGFTQHPSYTGTWEGAGIRTSHTQFGRTESLYNSRLVIDSMTSDYITGRIAYVIQEFNYAYCCFRFKALKKGNSYVCDASGIIPLTISPTAETVKLCYGLSDNEDCFGSMSITTGEYGPVVQFIPGKSNNCKGKLYFFKTAGENKLANEQNRRIDQLYEEWKQPQKNEKEKKREERLAKWGNQREYYSLTTWTASLKNTVCSYKYFRNDSLLIVKLDNVVPVPFKMPPADYQQLDISYMDTMRIARALFQSIEMGPENGLNSIWMISGDFQNLVPGKKILYPTTAQYESNNNVVQTKFSEKIQVPVIVSAKLEDEKIFGQMSLNSGNDNKAKTTPGGSEKAWYSSLPPCPCTYSEAKNKGKTSYPEGEWTDFGKADQQYHYGASKETRWTPVEMGKPGQQCTYDAEGKLITGGLAAGTPDQVSPGKILTPDPVFHFIIDVIQWSSLPCEEYLKEWQPDRGEYWCNRKANTVNGFAQLKNYVSTLTCSQITDIFKRFKDKTELNKVPVPAVVEFMNSGIAKDKNQATYLLQYFRGVVKNGVSGDGQHIKSFCEKVIKYLEGLLVTQPGKATFTIDPKYVTLPTDKEFKWYPWSDAPEDIKTAARFCRVKDAKRTLYDEIEDYLGMPGYEVGIAVIDLDNDGICGLVAEFATPTMNLIRGFSNNFCENGGIKTIVADSYINIKPSVNGIRSASSGKQYPLMVNTYISLTAAQKKQLEQLFTYDKTKATAQPQIITPAIPADLTGGTTPEELGKQLLKALQTNNKKLWASCIHPTYQKSKFTDSRQETVNEFDKIRESFEAKGITDWSKTSLSRVTFTRCDQCAPPGEKWLSQMLVEFWYKGKEFLAVVGFTAVHTYKGKYFVGSNYIWDMKRNK